jgi:hypothetical protein
VSELLHHLDDAKVNARGLAVFSPHASTFTQGGPLPATP